MYKRKIILMAAVLLGIVSCSTTRSLEDGEYLLRKNTIQVNDSSFDSGELSDYVAQKPNSYFLGLNPLLSVYNWSGKKSDGFAGFLRKLGNAPAVYQPDMVDKSIQSIQNHLRYIGYYGSQVESRVQVKKRKVYVTYYVALGKRYTISSIDYEVPSYGTFRQEFEADLPNTTLATGQYLSELALDKEVSRQSQYFRNLGYFGFTKSFYAFEADTLARDGTARLKMEIRDYALGDLPSASQEHKKYTIRAVTIAQPDRLKIRPSVIENLNTLKPGLIYSENAVNTAYSRLASVSMLTGVNINMNPVSDHELDCNISLRNARLQGFKANLEASVNSTGLVGISPQLTYYHRNVFNAGVLLNFGLKGNFQFQPGGDKTAYSTEFSLSSTLTFPKAIGIPNRVFSGPNLPKTDIALAFNYQDRPEFRRTVISSAMTYNGRFGGKWFYQLTPVRANIVRLFDISASFLEKIWNNMYMLNLYSDNFDVGVSGMLYYTTDSSAIPKSSYHYFRFSNDISGNVLSLFNFIIPRDEYGQHVIWTVPYSQYVRAEFQAGHTMRFGKNDKQALAMRVLMGAGYAYGNSLALPIERQFYAGGAMSMRGWQARTLGPGNDTTLKDIFIIPSQVGDIKLEANVEYRFPIFWKFEGALFVDAGNIWSMPGQGLSEESEFRFSTLGESIAMDWGLGIRVNLNFLLLRLDGGFRVHDPGREAGDRWVAPRLWIKDSNFAIHFGVGYPF